MALFEFQWELSGFLCFVLFFFKVLSSHQLQQRQRTYRSHITPKRTRTCLNRWSANDEIMDLHYRDEAAAVSRSARAPGESSASFSN